MRVDCGRKDRPHRHVRPSAHRSWWYWGATAAPPFQNRSRCAVQTSPKTQVFCCRAPAAEASGRSLRNQDVVTIGPKNWRPPLCSSGNFFGPIVPWGVRPQSPPHPTRTRQTAKNIRQKWRTSDDQDRHIRDGSPTAGGYGYWVGNLQQCRSSSFLRIHRRAIIENGITKRFAVSAIIVFLGASTSACTTGRTPLPHVSSPDIQGSPPSVVGNKALPTTVHPGSTSLPWHIQRIDDMRNRIYPSSDHKQCGVPHPGRLRRSVGSQISPWSGIQGSLSGCPSIRRASPHAHQPRMRNWVDGSFLDRQIGSQTRHAGQGERAAVLTTGTVDRGSCSIGLMYPSFGWRSRVEPGVPLLSVEQLDLRARPEGLHHRVVTDPHPLAMSPILRALPVG